jgi:hypothetical protein
VIFGDVEPHIVRRNDTEPDAGVSPLLVDLELLLIACGDWNLLLDPFQSCRDVEYVLERDVDTLRIFVCDFLWRNVMACGCAEMESGCSAVQGELLRSTEGKTPSAGAHDRVDENEGVVEIR